MPTRAPTHKPHPHLAHAQPREPDMRPTAHQRGYGARWRRLRDMVLKRDHYICQSCGEPSGWSAHVDHIQPRSVGGPDTLENLQTLCHDCHNRKTKQEN